MIQRRSLTITNVGLDDQISKMTSAMWEPMTAEKGTRNITVYQQTETRMCCSVLVWNVPLVPHREKQREEECFTCLQTPSSLPLSPIYRCGINSLLPGFDWMLAPLGEHVGLWSLAACGFTATVKERIPVLMDAQSRRVIMKGECDGWRGWGAYMGGGGGWSK